MTSWGVGGKTVAGAGHQLLTLTCLEPKLRQSLKHSGSAQNSAAAFLEEHELASPSCCQLHSKAVLAPCPERGREGDMGKRHGKDSKPPGIGLSKAQTCASRA